jgi:hypothetical protein
VIPLANVVPAKDAAGKPVVLVKVPDVGVPRIGVTRVGVLANTLAPVPVSSVKAAAKLADVGVAKKVPTPVPRPVIEPTAGVIVLVEAAVINPLPLTVKAGAAVADPKEPVLVLTVARVVAREAPGVVISPVRAGTAAVGKVVVPCITVAEDHVASWPDVGVPVFETFPPPDGVAHVASPLQNVDELADVPEFKLATGKLPVTPPVPDVARLIAGTLLEEITDSPETAVPEVA